MDQISQPNPLADRLKREIDLLDQQISELQQERMALERQLNKAKWEGHALRGVSRKNSMNRVLAEERVLIALRGRDSGLSVTDLHNYAKAAIPDLKLATFRTLLSRMHKRALIEQHRRGYWRLPS